MTPVVVKPSESLVSSLPALAFVGVYPSGVVNETSYVPFSKPVN